MFPEKYHNTLHDHSNNKKEKKHEKRKYIARRKLCIQSTAKQATGFF